MFLVAERHSGATGDNATNDEAVSSLLQVRVPCTLANHGDSKLQRGQEGAAGHQ